MKKQQIVRWVVAIVILFIAYRVFAGITSQKKTETAQNAYPVTVAVPTYQEISNKLALVGEVKGDTEVQVRPKTTGRVEELYVDEGSFVKRGQPLLSFKAGIDSSDELYPDLVTFAPVSGVVGVKLVKQGEQVVSSMGTINPVFSIYQIDNVKIYVNVAEKYASDLSTGLTAELKFDSMPDQTFKGIVNKVRPVLDSYSRTVQVEILVRNPKHLIKPGMFARVELMLQHKIKALVVPADAIMEDVSKYVLVSSNGQAVKKDIQTGVIGTDFVEVVSGIASTDSVIIVGQRVVKAGSQIEVKND